MRPGIGAGTQIAAAVFAAIGSLSSHRLLDRLIRGRSWIALVAFALIGIVTLQLGLLKLNGNIGRALESAALLQRENAALRIENSEIGAGNRVELRAAQIGMQFALPGGQRFLAPRSGIDATRAATTLSAPLHAQATPAEAASAGSAAPGAGAESSTATESSGSGTAPARSSSESAGAAAAQAGPGSSGATASSEPATARTEPAAAPSEPTTARGGSTTTPAEPSAASGGATTAPGAGAPQAGPAGGTQAGAPGG